LVRKTLHDIAVIVDVIKQKEKRGGVVLLQHRLIIVEDGELGPALHLKGVVGTWVINVMGCPREKREKHVIVCHLAKLIYATAIEEIHQVLHHIRSMYL
jgi:hypothetical protein